jgi:hypothetical protein
MVEDADDALLVPWGRSVAADVARFGGLPKRLGRSGQLCRVGAELVAAGAVTGGR